MMAQGELERVVDQLTEIRKLKLKDVQLDQFSGTEKEWRTFKISLSCTLTDFDLEDVMDGSEAFPFPEDPEHPTQLESAKIKLWTAKDGFCRKILLKFCKGAALGIIMAGAADERASDAWQRLLSRYEGNRRAREQILLTQLHESRMLKRPQDMNSHLESILEIVRQLEEIGSPVPAAQVRGVIAGSLPATTYDATLRENRRGDHGEDEDPMSIHRFCDALRQDAQELLHKEKRMTNVKISAGEPGISEDKIVALIARQLKHQKSKAGVSEKPRGDRDQNDKRCHHCGKKGHLERDCWGKHPERKPSNEDDKPETGRKDSKKKPKGGNFAAAMMTRCVQTNIANEVPQEDSQFTYWYADSGASNHMTADVTDFTNIDMTRRGKVQLASKAGTNGSQMDYVGVGEVVVTAQTSGGDDIEITLQEVLLVPDVERRLFSEEFAATKNVILIRTAEKFSVLLPKTGIEIPFITTTVGRFLKAARQTRDTESNRDQDEAEANKATKALDLWHERMGHANKEVVRRTIKAKAVSGVDLERDRPDKVDCDSCVVGKATVKRRERSTFDERGKPGDEVCTDTWGPVTPPAIASGHRYMVGYLDRKTRCTVVMFMRNKSEQPACFERYWADARSYGVEVRVLRSDGGSEFRNAKMEEICRERGVRQQFSSVHTAEQNGAIERFWRTLQDGTRAMLSKSHLPNNFWELAAAHKVFVNNRVLHPGSKTKVPAALFTKRPVDLSRIRVFGCLAYVVDQEAGRRKLDSRTWTGVYCGPDQQSLQHIIFDVNTKRFSRSRDVYFDEGKTIADIKNVSEPYRGPNLSFGNTDGDADRLQSSTSPDPRVSSSQLAAPTQRGSKFTQPEVTTPASNHKSNENEDEEYSGMPGLLHMPDSDDEDEAGGKPEAQTSTELKHISDHLIGGDIPEQPPVEDQLEETAERTAKLVLDDDTDDVQPDEQPSGELSAKGIWYPPNYGQGKYWERKGEKRERRPHVFLTQQRKQSSGDRPEQERRYERPRTNFPQERLRATDVSIPRNFREAIAGTFAGYWWGAMDAELNGARSKATWTLTTLQRRTDKVLQSKWVFSLKTDSNGYVTRFKARIVAVGTSQEQGVHYDESYAPVTNFAAMRMLVALAAMNGWKIGLADVKNAYLNTPLSDVAEGLYMTQPQGFEESGPHGEKLYCRLDKALYGLKQAGRLWHKDLSKWFLEHGYKRSRWDPCLFYKFSKKGVFLCVVWVDDDLFTGDPEMQKEFVTALGASFEITVRDVADTYLAIQIVQDLHGGRVSLHQTNYINELLARFKMEDANTADTPIDTTPLTALMSPQTDTEKEEMRGVPYRELIGSLLYLARCTRPDIAFAVNSLSRFSTNPGRSHWTAAKRVLRYLKGSKNRAVVYERGGAPTIHGFSDADWAGRREDRRSTSGYVYYMANGPIAWNTATQKSVSLSTHEAETMAASTAASEGIWLNRLLTEACWGVEFSPTRLGVDNQATFLAAKNDIVNGKAKHIDIREHFLREKEEQGFIVTEKIAGETNPADGFTKPLTRQKHQKFVEQVTEELERAKQKLDNRKTKGTANMFVSGQMTSRTKYLSIQFNGSELPFIIDSGCAPHSVIPAKFLNGMVYDKKDRVMVEEPYTYSDYQGNNITVWEEITLWVTTQVASEANKQRLSRLKFAIITGNGPNFVLLNEVYFSKFEVESPEILVWKSLGGDPEKLFPQYDGTTSGGEDEGSVDGAANTVMGTSFTSTSPATTRQAAEGLEGGELPRD